MNKDNAYQHKIVISKDWHNPTITVEVNFTGIDVSMSVEDFCKALAKEVKHPSLTFTRAGLEANLIAAVDAVADGMKDATIYT